MKNDLKNEYVDSNRIEGGKVALYVKIHGVWKICCRCSKNYNFCQQVALSGVWKSSKSIRLESNRIEESRTNLAHHAKEFAFYSVDVSKQLISYKQQY